MSVSKKKNQRPESLREKYPPSPACACEVCLGYCIRPGWWTVEEAGRAVEAGYAALAITDECSVAGIVRAHVAAKAVGLKLIVRAA